MSKVKINKQRLQILYFRNYLKVPREVKKVRVSNGTIGFHQLF